MKLHFVIKYDKNKSCIETIHEKTNNEYFLIEIYQPNKLQSHNAFLYKEFRVAPWHFEEKTPTLQHLIKKEIENIIDSDLTQLPGDNISNNKYIIYEKIVDINI